MSRHLKIGKNVQFPNKKYILLICFDKIWSFFVNFLIIGSLKINMNKVSRVFTLWTVLMNSQRGTKGSSKLSYTIFTLHLTPSLPLPLLLHFSLFLSSSSWLNFINVLCAAFAPTVLHQESTNLQHKHKKAAHET